MRILLLGANGQLGQELKCALYSVGNIKCPTRSEVDLTDSHCVRDYIRTFNPNVIVNAAAYTAVDLAESERQIAFEVNADAVAVLADEAAKQDIFLIHYSTDYVFDGSKRGPYLENDTPNPINVYGESKFAGEKAIQTSGCKHIIFRTTWVIGQDGHNFAKTILQLAIERDTLNIVNDQFGVPTTPALIAKVTVVAINDISNLSPWPVGLYHLAPSGETTWFGIAKTLISLAKEKRLLLSIDEKSLHPIKTIDYSTPAKRPANSLLNTNKLAQQLNFSLPHWTHDFSDVANSIIRNLKQHET